MRNTKTIFFLTMVLTSLSALSQEKNDNRHSWLSTYPIDISIGNVLVGMPFSNIVIQPYYPMLSIGSEFYYSQKDNSAFFQTVNSTYYYSKYSTSAFMVFSEIAYRYIVANGFFLDGRAGAGYAHLFRPNAIYIPGADGTYQQVRDWGTPGLMADFSFSLGYDFSSQNIPLSLYIKYGSYIDILYAPDIPALPHNSIQIGSRFFIRNVGSRI